MKHNNITYFVNTTFDKTKHNKPKQSKKLEFTNTLI